MVIIAGETGLMNYRNALGYSKWIDDFEGEQLPNGQIPAQIPNGGGGYPASGMITTIPKPDSAPPGTVHMSSYLGICTCIAGTRGYSNATGKA